MGIVIRQSILNTLTSYAGVALGYLNVIFLFPKFLTPEEHGLYRALLDIGLLLAPFAQLGLSQATIRFYPAIKDKRSLFFPFVVMASLIGYGLFFLIFTVFQDAFAALFKENASLIVQYFQVIVLLILLVVLNTIFESFCRARYKFFFPNFVREFLLRLLTTISLTLYIVNILDFDSLIFSILGIYGMASVSLLIYLIRLGEVRFSGTFKFLNRDFLKEFINYALFMQVGGSGILIVAKVDILMIGAMLGLEEIAIYTVAYYLATIIEMPKRSIVQITTPMLSTSFEKPDLRSIKNLYQKASINQLVVGGLIFLLLAAGMSDLFQIMPKGKIYQSGEIVILIIGLGKLIDMAAGINGEIIVMSRYYRFNILSLAVLAVFTVLLNLILIPVLGLAGAALASAITILVFNLLKMWYVKKKLKMQPFNVNTLKALGVLILVFAGSLFIPAHPNEYISLAIKGILISGVYLLLVVKLKISMDINDTLSKLIQKFFSFFQKGR